MFCVCCRGHRQQMVSRLRGRGLGVFQGLGDNRSDSWTAERGKSQQSWPPTRPHVSVTVLSLRPLKRPFPVAVGPSLYTRLVPYTSFLHFKYKLIVLSFLVCRGPAYSDPIFE